MDSRYLHKRGDFYYLRFRLPERFGGGIFQKSLRTSNFASAKKIRDRYVVPFLSSQNSISAINHLIHHSVSEQDQRDSSFKNLVDQSFLSFAAERIFLSEIANRYFEFLERSSLSNGTVSSYMGTIRGFLKIVGEKRFSEEISRTEVMDYRNRLFELPANWQKLKVIPKGNGDFKTVSHSQIKQSFDILKRFFKWLRKEGYTRSVENPFEDIEIPYARHKKRHPFTREEVEKACHLSFPHSDYIGADEWTLIPLVARYTGCRLGEIVQMEVSDLVEIHGIRCFKISEDVRNGKFTKTHEERIVPVHKNLEGVIKNLVEQRGSGRLFPVCGDYRGLNGFLKKGKLFGNSFNKIVKEISLDLSFHCFRHYAITEMANSGVAEEVRKRIVGHRTNSVHQGYTNIDIRLMKKGIDTIW